MVSNGLEIPLPELLAMLDRLRQEEGDNEEYRAARAAFPEDWPM